MIQPVQSLALLGGFSNWDMIIVLVIVLILFGPKSIPALARSLGQGVKEFKNASSKFNEALNDAAVEDDRKKAAAKAEEDRKPEVKELVQSSMPKHDLEVKDSVATTASGMKS